MNRRPLPIPFLPIVYFFLVAFFPAGAAGPAHPLDPLGAEEISTAVRLLKATPGCPKEALFSTLTLHEPPKPEVTAYRAGAPFRREAFAVLYDRAKNRTFEAVVDLKSRKTLSWKALPGVQPLLFQDEYELVPALVKADPRWQAALRKRGITDFDKVQMDTWAAGQVDGAPSGSGRLLRAVPFYRDRSTNVYGRPIEGVIALVDVTARKVVNVTDNEVVPLPPPSQEFDEQSTGTRSQKPKPLVISQPEGASFTLNGQEIRWQNWRFRFSMHPREGLVLHTVGYEEGDSLRPILYRASLSEMVVPYGDPAPDWRWRSAFDVGEYGVGRLASPLEPKIDAPDNARFFDATFADDRGRPYTLQRAAALYERDGGILWKHFESFTLKNESRRARELVLFFVATIGNYDYAVNYIFKQDASLEVDLALTGIMLPKGTAQQRAESHHSMGIAPNPMAEHLVSPNVVAPHHQHFFNFRLDLDVDGTENSVTEMNSAALPAGAANPHGNGFSMHETVFRTEAEAGRRMDLQSARTWTVRNGVKKNALGQPTSYILVPGGNSLPYVAEESSIRKRAAFINNHFWATRYHPQELYAAGTYPNQSKGGDGLPQFTADNEPLAKTDVVVWYTLGVTHIPRPEEWPVMPVTHTGFKLVPGGFFRRNPALDVPR
ncbi:primary-amine oxidase [Paraflavisolibacter sp. H34]|uniref:primary-amine oxidase n=1 Tax=Huijunlia imazamoxiresistens TaxID=3127457 RepID=UPI00301A562D